MIHRFSVSNYGSIREEVTLDLRIPGTAPELACFRRSAAKPDVRLPAVAVLMGSNGSGKTTLLRALVAAARIAVEVNHIIPIRIVPFLSDQTRWKETRFRLEGEWDFLTPGGRPQLFRYELAVKPEKTEEGIAGPLFICHETLVHFPGADPRGDDRPPPDVTFSDEMTLRFGGRAIELHYLGRSHTDNLIVTFLPEERIAFAVDFVSNDRVGFRDLPGWYFDEFYVALDLLMEIPFETMVFGHGDVGDRGTIERSSPATRTCATPSRPRSTTACPKRKPWPGCAWTTTPTGASTRSGSR